ncbi:YggT family protein [Sphingomicrobium nitratireducens]|uniref:YggT family protein n=1 Tax=Sphingomicrobium nitratireducens TaxID=2964666 RepID=UPI00223FEDE3|nr:YggT family protein [Sphingomicrobium nitratireducens]
MIFALFQIVDMLLQVLTWIIIGQVILSWLFAFNVINPHSGFVRTLVEVLERITAPFYRPIRKFMPDFGGLDFSPLVLLLAIYIVRQLLYGVALELGPTVL